MHRSKLPLLARIMHGVPELAWKLAQRSQFPDFGHGEARRFESRGRQAEFAVEEEGFVRGHRRPAVQVTKRGKLPRRVRRIA